jgi:dimethylglycine catabolism A
VLANEDSFTRYIDQLYGACVAKQVRFVFNTDVASRPLLLDSFDRIVIATGARYRFCLGPVAKAVLNLGAARWPGIRTLFEQSKFRDWFYYRAREGTAPAFKNLAKPTQKVIAIGDAVEAGKSKAAISSAFEAALLTH